jgi:hypothetical protein
VAAGLKPKTLRIWLHLRLVLVPVSSERTVSAEVSDCASLYARGVVECAVCNSEPGAATKGTDVGTIPSRRTPCGAAMVSFRSITSLLDGAGRQGAVDDGLLPKFSKSLFSRV